MFRLLLPLTVAVTSASCSLHRPAGAVRLDDSSVRGRSAGGASWKTSSRRIERADPPVCRKPSPVGLLDADEAALLAETVEILAMIESRDANATLSRIGSLAQRYPGDRSAVVLEHVLGEWLLRQRPDALDCRAERHDPTPADHDLATAEGLLDVRLRGDAIAALEQAHTLDPTNVDVAARLADLLEEEGLTLYGRGSVDEAIAVWRRALAVSPGDPQIRRYLARAEIIRRETDRRAAERQAPDEQ